MSHINFLPKRGFGLNLQQIKDCLNVEHFKTLKLDKLSMMVIVMSLVVFMIFFGIVQKVRLNSLADDKLKLESEVMKLKDRVGDISLSNSNVQSSVNHDYAGRVKWSDILNKLSIKFPHRVWLNSLDGGFNKNKSIKLIGEAPDQTAVASLINSLNSLNAFMEVTLVSSGKGQDKENKKTIVFQIEGRLK